MKKVQGSLAVARMVARYIFSNGVRWLMRVNLGILHIKNIENYLFKLISVTYSIEFLRRVYPPARDIRVCTGNAARAQLIPVDPPPRVWKVLCPSFKRQQGGQAAAGGWI